MMLHSLKVKMMTSFCGACEIEKKENHLELLNQK